MSDQIKMKKEYSKNVTDLIKYYKNLTEKDMQDEIDILFEEIYAILEASECDSIESYPNVNVKLKFSCEVLKEESKYLC